MLDFVITFSYVNVDSYFQAINIHPLLFVSTHIYTRTTTHIQLHKKLYMFEKTRNI